MFTRLLILKDTSGTSSRTSVHSFWEKPVRIKKKAPKIKLRLVTKEYITSEKVKIIEIMSILPSCILSMHREANF